jgi:hypothetical protein
LREFLGAFPGILKDPNKWNWWWTGLRGIGVDWRVIKARVDERTMRGTEVVEDTMSEVEREALEGALEEISGAGFFSGCGGEEMGDEIWEWDSDEGSEGEEEGEEEVDVDASESRQKWVDAKTDPLEQSIPCA